MAADAKARPVLLSFQEPSVIHTMRRPVTLIRKWNQLVDEIARNGEVVSAVLPEHLRAISIRPHLDATIQETMTVFNISKGENQTIHFVSIRLKGTVAIAKQVERLLYLEKDNAESVISREWLARIVDSH